MLNYQSGEIIHQIFFRSEILREIFSVCVFASTQKQKSPLTHNFFTLTSFSKNKGTMDKRVTELHVRVFFSLKFFRKKVRASCVAENDTFST